MQFVYPLMLFLLFVIGVPLLCYFNNFKIDPLSLDFNVAVHKLAGITINRNTCELNTDISIRSTFEIINVTQGMWGYIHLEII